MKVYCVSWRGPYSLDEIVSNDFSDEDPNVIYLLAGKCLYERGDNKIQYIGISGQGARARLRCHQLKMSGMTRQSGSGISINLMSRETIWNWQSLCWSTFPSLPWTRKRQAMLRKSHVVLFQDIIKRMVMFIKIKKAIWQCCRMSWCGAGRKTNFFMQINSLAMI